MYRHQMEVKSFHEKFKAAINEKPTIPSDETLRLRCKLLLEEVIEFCQAAGFGFSINAWDLNKIHFSVKPYPDKKADLIEMADALADIQYVTDGAGLALGIDLEPISIEVHRSNMSKLWPLETTIPKEYIAEQVSQNEWLVKDEHGKVIKSPNYSPADIEGELIKQGYKK